MYVRMHTYIYSYTCIFAHTGIHLCKSISMNAKVATLLFIYPISLNKYSTYSTDQNSTSYKKDCTVINKSSHIVLMAFFLQLS